MRRYDFVSLDAQGTLIRPRPSLSAIYQQVCSRFGRDVTAGEVSSCAAAIWAEHRDSPEAAILDTSDDITREWWARFNSKLFHRLGMTDNQEGFVQALWDVFGDPVNWELFPEVRDVLAELKGRGYRLGIVSNWDSRLLTICERLELSSQVDFVIASASAGMEKPDRRIFEIALAAASTPARRAVHIGDDYVADIVGANGAGLDAVLIDRDGRGPRHDGTTTIESLTGLLDMLD
ncbi:MAG TPA: HAD-IA family hydrolase [Chloroflexota bacterium]